MPVAADADSTRRPGPERITERGAKTSSAPRPKSASEPRHNRPAPASRAEHADANIKSSLSCVLAAARGRTRLPPSPGTPRQRSSRPPAAALGTAPGPRPGLPPRGRLRRSTRPPTRTAPSPRRRPPAPRRRGHAQTRRRSFGPPPAVAAVVSERTGCNGRGPPDPGIWILAGGTVNQPQRQGRTRDQRTQRRTHGPVGSGTRAWGSGSACR